MGQGTEQRPETRNAPQRVIALACGVLAGLAGAAGLWALLLQAQLGAATESSRWIHEAAGFKRARAHATPGARLLVVSGSNGLFGIRAEQIERELGRPSINLAVHAGLGLDYMLRDALSLARPGDTILLALEYSHYRDMTRVDPVLLDYVLARDPDYFRQLPLPERVAWALATPGGRLLQGLLARIGLGAGAAAAYQSGTLNGHGDETGNIAEARTAGMLRRLAGLGPQDWSGAFDPEADALRHLRGFAQACGEAGVSLLATFPSYVHFDDYEAPEQRAFFDSIVVFYAELGIPTLGGPYEFMYPRERFFDTRYHLDREAAAEHTDRLIRYLHPEMACLRRGSEGGPTC